LSARRSAGVIAVAAAASLIIWTVVRLLGVELTVAKGPDPEPGRTVEALVRRSWPAWRPRVFTGY
jgi:hypothetical protein